MHNSQIKTVYTKATQNSPSETVTSILLVLVKLLFKLLVKKIFHSHNHIQKQEWVGLEAYIR